MRFPGVTGNRRLSRWRVYSDGGVGLLGMAGQRKTGLGVNEKASGRLAGQRLRVLFPALVWLSLVGLLPSRARLRFTRQYRDRRIVQAPVTCSLRFRVSSVRRFLHLARWPWKPLPTLNLGNSRPRVRQRSMAAWCSDLLVKAVRSSSGCLDPETSVARWRCVASNRSVPS